MSNNISTNDNRIGSISALCTRLISQEGSISTSNMDSMSIKLHNNLKDRCATHGNRFNNFGDLAHDNLIGDGVNYQY